MVRQVATIVVVVGLTASASFARGRPEGPVFADSCREFRPFVRGICFRYCNQCAELDSEDGGDGSSEALSHEQRRRLRCAILNAFFSAFTGREDVPCTGEGTEGSPTSSPTATFTPIFTVTATASPEGTATETPPPTATETSVAEATATFTAIATSTATSAPEGTATETPLPTDTPEATATFTAIATSTATTEPEGTATETPLPTPTNTPNATATFTAIATSTATSEPEGTATETTAPTPTDTPDPTATFTAIATSTASSEPEGTATETPLPTATDTPDATATLTAIATSTATSEPEGTATETPEATATSTAIATATGTSEPEGTATETPPPTPTVTSAADDEDARAFVTRLSGDNEVPSVETDGTGRARLTLRRNNTALRYRLRVRNLTGITQAHIHCGAPGVNGPVVAFLFGPIPGGFDPGRNLARGSVVPGDVMTVPDSPQCPGGIATFAELIAKMRAGQTYVNVHTLAHASGEIRGQIEIR